MERIYEGHEVELLDYKDGRANIKWCTDEDNCTARWLDADKIIVKQ